MGVSASCMGRPGAPTATAGNFTYMIAANLFNCEAIMPYWVVEVLRLGMMLEAHPIVLNSYSYSPTYKVDPGWDPTLSPKVSVSIYESGSTDSTPKWLEAAEALWAAAGMRTFVVLNGSLTRQTTMDPFSGKFSKQHRIEFLATLRNAALEPLYSAKPGTWQFVYFINDVFFCAPDLLRLSHFQADIACGLDFEIWIGNLKGRAPGLTQRFLRRRLLSARPPGGGAGRRRILSEGDTGAQRNIVAEMQKAIEHMSIVHVDEAARQSAADSRIKEAKTKPRYEFYDTWVSRDIGGNPFIKDDPIARDTRTIESLHRGLPIPAKCCWNGAAFINASLLAAGLRFRSSLVDENECDTSECSLFCEDYRRLGSKRVVVDPSVRVSYLAWTKDIHGHLPGGIGAKVPWIHVQRSGALAELKRLWRDTSGCMSNQCVPLRKGTEEADIHAFKVVDLATNNYTAMFLDRLVNPRPPPPPPRTCNLLMGPYGAPDDGRSFDDLGLTELGAKPISAINFRVAANASGPHSGISGLQVSYADVQGDDHGREGLGEEGSHFLQPDEFVKDATVYYDHTIVFGLRLVTNADRELEIGTFPRKASRARASPCPAESAQAGRHRLIAFSGSNDKFLRSVALAWVPQPSGQ